MLRSLARVVPAALLLAGAAAAVRAGEPPPTAPAAPPPFAPLDIPDWRIADDPSRLATEPWLLVVDDPQCPYCMLLHLGIVKARAAGDAELAHAAIVHLPYPLYTHDQSAHIVMDAFCLEASRSGHPWSAAAYLDWLLEGSWSSEPEWSSSSFADFAKAGGPFDTKYESHQVTSSRLRDYLTPFARAEAACVAPPARGLPYASCAGDPDCDRLCDKQLACREQCAAESASGGEAPQPPGDCLASCTARFVHARWAQFAEAHSACLLASGPDSAQAKTAAAIAWANAHEVPGTPTLYIGHPRIGFRTPPDPEDLPSWIAAIDKELAEVRRRLAAQP